MLFSELLQRYKRAFRASGGKPEECAGVLWSDRFIQRDPAYSISDFLQAISYGIDRGETNCSWILALLNLNWKDLSESERIESFFVLSKRGLEKALLNKSLFKNRFTENEISVLADLLRGRGSHKAADRIIRERMNGG
jgi:hypothetical protein